MTDRREDDDRLVASTSVPCRVVCDITRLSLGRMESFVLSQIDGCSSVEDIATIVGLTPEQVRQVVARLVEFGAVSVPEGGRRASAAPPRGSSPRTPSSPPSRDDPPVAPLSVPRLAARSHAGLPVTVEDAFVLGQVDGSTSVSDLGAITGIELVALGKALRRLERVGAIELADAEPQVMPRHERAAVSVDVFSSSRERRKPDRPGPGAPPSHRGVPVRGATPSPSRRAAASPSRNAPQSPPRKATPSPWRKAMPSPPRKATPSPLRRATPSPLRRASPPPSRRPSGGSPRARPSAQRPRAEADDGACELSPDLQARVAAMHASLKTTSHQALLGIDQGADKATIKRAYFGLVSTLHPDRHFNKKLGPFKQKLEEIFVQVTLAYETLTKQARQPPVTAPPADARARPVTSPPLETRGNPTAMPSLGPPSSDPAAPRGDGPPRTRIRIETGRTARVSMPVKVSDEEATRASNSGWPRARTAPPVTAPPPVSDSSPSLPPSGDPQHALQRFMAGKVEHDSRERARVFAEAGEYELAKGNVIAAAVQFQFAVNCCDAPELRAVLEAVEVMANERRFEVQLTRAETAERASDWSTAVDGYGRAHGARPDPRVAERLANAIRMAGGDLRRAGKLLEDAIAADPENVGLRVTLAEVYADAGLDLRAQAETTRVLGVAPAHPRAQALAAKLAAKARGR